MPRFSPHDFEDALTVLERMRGKFDVRYLNRLTRELGLAEELSYIRKV